MAGLTGLFKDPEKLARVSEFLTGMGAGMRQNSGPGVSTLASLGAGFTGGGQNIVAQREKRNLMQQKKIAQQLQTQQLLAAQQKRQQEANDLARNQVFREKAAGLNPNSETYANDLARLALTTGGTAAKDALAKLKTVSGMDIANRNQIMKEALFPGEQAAQQYAANDEQRKIAKELREATAAGDKQRLVKAKADLAEWKAENPESGSGISFTSSPDGGVEFSTGITDKVEARKTKKRWQDLNIASMAATATKNSILEQLRNDQTLIGIPGGVQEHLSTAFTGLGRMGQALGLDSVPVVDSVLKMYQKVGDLGWAEAGKERIKLQSDLTYLKSTLLDLVPSRSRRLKSEVEAFSEMVGNKETNPELLIERLVKLTDNINDSIAYELIAKSWGSIGQGIEKGTPDQLALFPIDAMNNAQITKWAKRVPVSSINVGKLSREQWASLNAKYDELPDDWKEMIDVARTDPRNKF